MKYWFKVSYKHMVKGINGEWKDMGAIVTKSIGRTEEEARESFKRWSPDSDVSKAENIVLKKLGPVTRAF